MEEKEAEVHRYPPLLSIKTVGVQGDSRSYSYAVGIISVSDPDWEDLLYLAKIIPRVCHNINRICYIFGGPSNGGNLSALIVVDVHDHYLLGDHHIPDPLRAGHHQAGQSSRPCLEDQLSQPDASSPHTNTL